MSRFIEECRREWRRLRVPDPVADDMAADLAADLEEAAAEGASAEEVLGSGASDPRSFAASWAAERGVIPPPPVSGRLARPLTLAATVAVTVIAVVGAALAIFGSPRDSARVILPPAPFVQVMPASTPTAAARTVVSPDGMWVVTKAPETANSSGVDAHTVGSILLSVGIAGMILSMLFLVWSSRAPGHWSRRRTYIDQAPSGSG